jgi:hypothetical protein
MPLAGEKGPGLPTSRRYGHTILMTLGERTTDQLQPTPRARLRLPKGFGDCSKVHEQGYWSNQVLAVFRCPWLAPDELSGAVFVSTEVVLSRAWPVPPAAIRSLYSFSSP